MTVLLSGLVATVSHQDPGVFSTPGQSLVCSPFQDFIKDFLSLVSCIGYQGNPDTIPHISDAPAAVTIGREEETSPCPLRMIGNTMFETQQAPDIPSITAPEEPAPNNSVPEVEPQRAPEATRAENPPVEETYIEPVILPIRAIRQALAQALAESILGRVSKEPVIIGRPIRFPATGINIYPASGTPISNLASLPYAMRYLEVSVAHALEQYSEDYWLTPPTTRTLITNLQSSSDEFLRDGIYPLEMILRDSLVQQDMYESETTGVVVGMPVKDQPVSVNYTRDCCGECLEYFDNGIFVLGISGFMFGVTTTGIAVMLGAPVQVTLMAGPIVSCLASTTILTNITCCPDDPCCLGLICCGSC